MAGTSGTFRTDFCKSPSCGSFCSYLQGTGLQRRHIIAMQGPFSAEMNYIQLKEFQCSYMVTKDGGDTGGFKEKMQAAKKAGATAVVIDRPKDKGMSLEQTKEAVKEWMKDVSE